MKISEIYKLLLQSNGVVIDSRKIQKNDFFVAIKGENFDANTFAQQALDNGALCVVIDNPDYYIDQRTILVENSLETLQQLANFHRKQLALSIIALTGSNGKTTSKELINAVLSEKYKTKATVGNLNNHIGVPLTLLSFDYKTEVGIVEMGANHKQEIEFLCQIAEPNLGYITNFGKAHLEGFGGFEGVIQGKSELYQYIRSENFDEEEGRQKWVFINLDDAIQVEKSEGLNRFSFSFKNKNAAVFIDSVEANPFVKIKFEEAEIQSNLVGMYNAPNITAAIAIGKYFRVDTKKIKKAIENYTPTNNRSQIIEKNSNKIILDAYNANPSSMKAAIENFLNLDGKSKMMILGDMFELGTESLQEHKNIISLTKNKPDVEVLFVGNDFYSNQTPNEHLVFFESFEKLKEYLLTKKPIDKDILIKGSRGMALERALDFL
ncbi:MAG: UDP-N-acetylmuramoyl-tripeptide--D-alanyl-D-alanine ligase [Flavobacteriaceae bacterium]